MGLKPGQTNNRKGRPKGSINKISGDLRTDITDFLQKNFKTVVREWNKTKGRDKLQFYRDLLQYSVPKMQAVDLQTDLDKLNDQQIDDIFNRIMNQINTGNE